ncbi:MAG: hypothetical protein ACRC2P_02100, partial [Eubacterium aggregans]
MIPAALFGTVTNIMVGANLLPEAIDTGLLEFVNFFGIAILLAGAIAIININRGAGDDYLSRLYGIFIMIVAFLSIVPMMFKAMTPVLSLIDT